MTMVDRVLDHPEAPRNRECGDVMSTTCESVKTIRQLRDGTICVNYLLGRATLPVAALVAVLPRALVITDITVTVAAPLITCPCTFDTRTLNRAPLSPSAADARV